MTKKSNIYIKPQLCKEFGLSENALGHLTEIDLIKPDWQYRHGLQVVDLSDKDRRVLACAKNSPHNVVVNRLPFQRFLSLRFLQMPIDLIEFELREKNLFDCTKLSAGFLQARYELFLAGIPDVLQDCIEDYRPPKTKEEKELFDILLDVCEIRLAYEHPEWEQAMLFMANAPVKTVIDSAVTTTGTYEQIAVFINEALGISISAEALLFYQMMFHDMELMQPADIKLYFKGISPSRRQELSRAHGQSLDVYRLQSGVQADIRADEVIDIALSQIARRILDLTAVSSSVNSDEVYKAIRAFNILTDRHTRVADTARNTNRETVIDVFKQLKVAEQPVEHGRILIENPNNATTYGTR